MRQMAETVMIISKTDSTPEIETFIESEQERYESKNGVSCNYTPFCFEALVCDEIVGAVSGATCFSEIYIDELVVKEAYRGQGIGTRLIEAVEKYYKGCGFQNINCCTNGFQAPAFYEKCGFELEFVRENKKDSRLNKYFYVKFLT